MKKRIGTLLITVMMLFNAFSVLAANEVLAGKNNIELLPAVEGQKNVIRNAEMEGEGSLAEWLPYGDTWDGKASIDYEKFHGGKSSLWLSDLEGKKPWARQLVPVVGGATYQLTGWVWTERDAGPIIKFEGYNAPTVNAEFATTNETIGLPVNTGSWEQFSYMYTPHQNTRYVALYVRMSGGGSVWYDDLSMTMVQGPSKFDVNINSKNYYVSETEGYVTFSVNKDAYVDFSDWSIDYRILSGEQVISEKKGIGLATGEAELAFDISACDDKEATYTFEASLSEGDKKATEVKTVSFKRKYERPTCIGEDGLYYDENGEVFHPVTSYHMYDFQDTAGYMATMGINVVQIPHGGVATPEGMISTLDLLHKKGVKGLICLYYKNVIASAPENKELVKKYVETIKDHPAVWAWAIQDEPVSKNTDEALVTEAYELVRDIDPVHPVYTIDQREWMYPQLIRNADIVSIDNYPYGTNDAMEYIYSSTKYAVEVAGKSGKPIIPLLQFFARGSGVYSQGKLYFPTGNAMRNMIYQGFMAGAKGYGFFAFDHEVDGVHVADTETGDAIREFAAKEKEMMFDYFVEKKYTTFNSNYEDNPDCRYFSFVKDGEIILVVLNRHEYEETSVQIPLVSDNGLIQIGSFTAEAYAGTTGNKRGTKQLNLTLEPGAANVYKIKTGAKIDEEKLKEEVNAFSDLSGYDWAAEQIEALYKKDIVNMPEEGKFLPGQNITRGEFAYFLVRTLGLTNDAGEQFADVSPDSFYAKEIAIGRAAGIINGVGENSYAPDAQITRQDMMTLIARGLSLTGKYDLSRFPDADGVADYAAEGVAAMLAEGLIQGNADGTLNPLGNTTRAEAAVIMERILKRK